MTASSWSVALAGLDGELVEVEAAVGGGTSRTVLVGLPDNAIKEARDRVRAAVSASGYPWPSQQLTVNLSPAGLPKNGTHYDLALAMAALAATEQAPTAALRQCVLLGELGLDGRVRKVRGLLPALMAASRRGLTKAIIPAGQGAEASLVPGMTIWPVSHLREAVGVLEGRPVLGDPEPAVQQPAERNVPDLSDVQGHAEARWALEVAAAGRHHVLFSGPPGVGKTMLASRLPGILPDLSSEEAIEVSAIHSLAGLDVGGRLVARPPFSDPHHNATFASLVGGGSRDVRPGSISLAHRGVLFLDEAAEFGARLLDSLRTPLESGRVLIGRVNQQVTFPARFQLVLATNPCPCGKAGVAGMECTCTPLVVRKYQERISGPILDRIDIRHQLLPMKRAFLQPTGDSPECSEVVRARVLVARERQARRLRGTPWLTNAEVAGAHLRRHLPLPEDTKQLDAALARGALSPRGVDRVLRLGWTLADLEGKDRITTAHLRLAMRMRAGELGVGEA